jgi:hypothetical protein
MRYDQYIGLTEKAISIVCPGTQTVLYTTTVTYPDGHTETFEREAEESIAKHKTYEEVDGAWAENFLSLQEYVLPDGRVIREYVQAEPWSSGPCYFLALEEMIEGEWEVLVESLWTEAAIDRIVSGESSQDFYGKDGGT